MGPKPAEHVRPAVRRRPANTGTSIHIQNTNEEDTAIAASASQVPAFNGVEANEGLSLVGLSKSVSSGGSLNRHTKKEGNPSSKVTKAGRLLQKKDIEARPPGGRRSRAFRNWNSSPQPPVDDARLQAQKAALVLVQQAGATGNFKSLDSQFNNVLIPVVPTQFLSKSKTTIGEAG